MLRFCRVGFLHCCVFGFCLFFVGRSLIAQEPASPPAAPPPPKGTVIFEREAKPTAEGDTTAAPAEQAAPDANAAPEGESSSQAESSSSQPEALSNQPQALQRTMPPDAAVTVTDEERDAITFTAYDLELHLVPAVSGIEAHANFTVRNDGKVALKQVAVQVSSSLAWDSLRVRAGGTAAGTFVQHRLDTDADHTGVAREAVLTLAQPLAPGASLDLTAIYSGSIGVSAQRLERIGAPADQAEKADWDTISPELTGLRGYGNVMWYPVAGAPVFLGDGAKLFDAVGRTRLRQQSATVRLRLTVEYKGDAPDAVYFCGRRELFTAVSETSNLPVAAGQGVATAEFAPRLLGFRAPSLFITDRAATTTDGALLRAVTDQAGVLDQYAAAAAKAQPLLMDWLGDNPIGPLDVIDHDGQPFEDGAFLVTPLRAAPMETLTPVLVHTLAHAWFASSHVWLDEGVAQFLSLLWVETNDGRAAGLARLQASYAPLALAEPDFSAAAAAGNKGAGAAGVAAVAGSASGDAAQPRGQSLIDASSEIYYRTKAAAVLWMLRSITSDEALKQALQQYRHSHAADATAEGFEQVLEQTSHKDLKWFFDDWVYRDRGLPDLSIAYVAPRPEVDRSGKTTGWLVAIDVRNDGDAVAEVPVTVRSAKLTITERLRIPGRSNAATRITFQDTPEEVIVNDGTVPEVRESTHTKQVVVKTE
jgi:hypothetical protein